jgi:hypothetical protein
MPPIPGPSMMSADPFILVYKNVCLKNKNNLWKNLEGT